MLAVTLVAWGNPTTSHGASLVIDDFKDLEVTTSHPDTVRVENTGTRLAVSIDCSEPKRVFVRIPVDYTVQDQKMRISLGGSSGVSYVGKLETLGDGNEIPRTFEHTYIDYHQGPVLFSLDNKHYEHLSLYFHCISKNPDITGLVYIDKIEIIPLQFYDDRDFAYALAVIILALFLLPGLLLYSLFFGEDGKIKVLTWLTPLSLCSFLALYPILLLHQWLSPTPSGWTLLGAYIAMCMLLVMLLRTRGKLKLVAVNLVSIKFELLAVFVAALGVAALVTEDLDLPLHTFNHLHLRYLTYDVFYAHDPIFQYVNGIAIYHDEPFSRYYGNEKLVYEVQDRAIMAGVIYAVVRGIASPFGMEIAFSNGFYTLFGCGLNQLVLLPVFALHAYFSPKKSHPFLILFLLSAGAFMVSNYLIAWYKLAGAGLVISGVLVLLLDKHSIRQWALAGFLWGIATNFHPSLALTYPLLTLWLLARFFRSRQQPLLPAAGALLALALTFVAMNTPWSMVKANYFEDTNTLFRQHFLGFQRYSEERGIVGTLEDFADRYTLEQQISKRYHRLAGSLRLDEMGSLITPDQDREWEDVLLRWNALETSYIIFVFMPLLVLLIVSSLLARLVPAAVWTGPVVRHPGDFRWLLITQILTVLLVIVGSFGPFEPDINWHVPMSCVVILLYLLIHANLAVGKIGAALLIIYAASTYYRLFFQYF